MRQICQIDMLAPSRTFKKAKIASLSESILLTGSQFNSQRAGIMWLYFLAPDTILRQNFSRYGALRVALSNFRLSREILKKSNLSNLVR